MNDVLKKIKDNFALLLQFSTWTLFVITSFLILPVNDNVSMWVNFSRFFSAVLVGLIIIPVLKFSKRKHSSAWLYASILLFVAGFSMLFVYQHFLLTKTLRINSGNGDVFITVIGNNNNFQPGVKKELDTARQEIGNLPEELSNEEIFRLLPDRRSAQSDTVAELTSRIWHAEDIEYNRNKLLLLYFSLIALFTYLIIALIQAIACYNDKTTT